MPVNYADPYLLSALRSSILIFPHYANGGNIIKIIVLSKRSFFNIEKGYGIIFTENYKNTE